jgi:probable selenium-dependent hydroxylase accessory protein YqeC
MCILRALSVPENKKSIISLVGGGGKTSIMFRLAEELKNLQRKVLITTTTAIFYPGQAQFDRLFLLRDMEDYPNSIQLGDQGGTTVIGNYVTEENKLKGISTLLVDDLYNQGIFDNIIVEADGSKRKPIKAPDSHEPVISSLTTKLVGVIGFDCYLREIGPDWVHRPEILASLTGKRQGDAIDDEVIEKLVLSSEGLFKNCPELAEKILFINKVESSKQLEAAERIGRSILEQSTDITKVVIASLHNDNPIRVIMEREKK